LERERVLNIIPEIILFQDHREFSSLSSSPSPRERIEMKVQQNTKFTKSNL
jgi:hypothetical protein